MARAGVCLALAAVLAGGDASLPRHSKALAVVPEETARRCGLNVTQRAAADRLLAEVSARLQPKKRGATSAAPASGTPLKRTWLEVGEGGSRCLDGSRYGFYYREAPAGSPNAQRWVIFLQGGGLCLTIFDCWTRTRDELGSSLYWSENHTDVDNVLNQNATANPFHDFNHAWLPYCSGDTHSGTQTARNGYGLYFSGALNVAAAIARLRKDFRLGDAERVILSGGSAGGIGTHLHTDWLQAQLPAADVYAMPMAGQFFPKHLELSLTEVLRVLHILTPTIEINQFFTMVVTSLWDSQVPEPCAARLGPDEAYRCWDAGTNYDYITTPTLYVQNMFDQLQIEDVMLCVDCPAWAKQYIAYFGDKMRQTYAKPPAHSTRRNSVWLQACYDHTDRLCLSSQTTIDGTGVKDVAKAWFFDGVDRVVVDTCATSPTSPPCNPTCDLYKCIDM